LLAAITFAWRGPRGLSICSAKDKCCLPGIGGATRDAQFKPTGGVLSYEAAPRFNDAPSRSPLQGLRARQKPFNDRVRIARAISPLPLRGCASLARQISAGAIDVEGQHRHRRSEGLDFRLSLDSAERLSDLAISVALFFSNTLCSRSTASECAVTSADHRFFCWYLGTGPLRSYGADPP
jgi:hypothetical protein